MRWLVVAIAAVACSRASDEGENKQWQTQPPPAAVTVPLGLAIAVDVDGAGRPAITTDTLKTTKPDFVDIDRHAWLIASLVPDAKPAGSMVEAASASGVSIKITRPTADGLEPVLFLTRRGEILVSEIDPKDPFPRYHGKGGRLHRAGDPMPRVVAVAKLSITHGKPTP